jgi:hypothetical protein
MVAKGVRRHWKVSKNSIPPAINSTAATTKSRLRRRTPQFLRPMGKTASTTLAMRTAAQSINYFFLYIPIAIASFSY